MKQSPASQQTAEKRASKNEDAFKKECNYECHDGRRSLFLWKIHH